MTFYTDIIKRAQANVEKAKAEMRSLRANAKLIAHIGRAIEKIEADGFKANVDPGQGIWIWARIEGVPSLKDERILAALERIEQATGIEFKESHDDPDQLCRRFSGFACREGLYIHATVAAYAASDSPTCRKVEVGRELVEVVKHEIVCG